MLEFSSAGAKVKYCVETTAGSIPASGFIEIPCIKSTPDFNAEPSNLDVTDLSDTTFKRSIPGLRDLGGAVSFTANLTASFKTAWNSCVSAATTGFASGKTTWFEICLPNFDSFYFAGMPSELGIKGLEVDSVAEIDAYVTPSKVEGWRAAST